MSSPQQALQLFLQGLEISDSLTTKASDQHTWMRTQLQQRRMQRGLIAFHAEAKDAREGILRHACGQTLHFGSGQRGQTIVGRREGAAIARGHIARIPSPRPAGT